HGIPSPSHEARIERELRWERAPVELNRAVHVRIAFEELRHAPSDQDLDARIGKPRPERAKRGRREQEVPRRAVTDDEETPRSSERTERARLCHLTPWHGRGLHARARVPSHRALP